MAMKNCGNIQKYIKIIIPFKLWKSTVLKWKPSCKDFMFLPGFYSYPFHHLYFFLASQSSPLIHESCFCSPFMVLLGRHQRLMIYCYNFYRSVIICLSYSILFSSLFKLKNTTSQVPPLLTKIFWNVTQFDCLHIPYYK